MGPLKVLLRAFLCVALTSCWPSGDPTQMSFHCVRIEVDGKPLQIETSPGSAFTAEVCGNQVRIHPAWAMGIPYVRLSSQLTDRESIVLAEAAFSVEGFPPEPEVYAAPRNRGQLEAREPLPQLLSPELVLRAFPAGSLHEEGTSYLFRFLFKCENRLVEILIEGRLQKGFPRFDE